MSSELGTGALQRRRRGGTHLLCVLDDRLAAVRLDHVIRVLPIMSADVVPGAPPAVAGFVNVAGEPLPLLRLRALFGLPAVDDDVDHRVVLCAAAGRTLGLIVDDVLGLGEPTARRSPTEDDGIVTTHGVEAVGLVGDRLCLLVDAAAVADALVGLDARAVAPKQGDPAA